MIIKDIEIYKLAVPLRHPFVTALRRVETAEDVVIKIITDEGTTGWGSAPSTPVITGDTHDSVIGALKNIYLPLLKGRDAEDMEALQSTIHHAMLHNTSVKACLDMALYDLWAQKCRMPLYKLLGNYRSEFASDLTISLGSVEDMIEQAREAVARGYRDLKIKVGDNAALDLERIRGLRKAFGKQINLRLDANQGWKPKEAVRLIRKIEDEGLDIQLIEQPVHGRDLKGLAQVTHHVDTPIMADESAFSPEDVMQLIEMRACDLLNLKLMKTGGIHRALQIIAMAEVAGISCMMGCMLESKIGITAAAALVGAKAQFEYADLDAGDLMAADPVKGGIIYEGSKVILPQTAGLGIEAVAGLVKI